MSKRTLAIPVFTFVCLLAACGASPAYSVRGEDPAPGADAEIYLRERAPNQEVRIEVNNLLPPDRAQAGAQGYAVWIQPAGRDPEHKINLDYDRDGRSGEATFMTPHAVFRLFITAEDTELPAAPRGPQVLSQQVGSQGN